MRFVAAVAMACAAFACAAPALAVDRTLGADVPKPVASGAPWTDAEISALDANADIAIAGSSTVRGAHVGIYAIDARDGRVLYQRNADDAFQPASTFKLLVGSAALDKLGPDFRFHTDAVAAGPVVDGELRGYLIVRAGGDPFLKNADLDDLAAAVSARGIRSIRDNVAFDVTHFERPGYSPGWSWDDFPYDYAPVVGALAFEENVVHLTIAPGAAPGDRAVVTSAPVRVLTAGAEGCAFGTLPTVIDDVRTGPADAKDTVDLERTALGCTRAFGVIPAGAKPDTLDAAVPFPAVYAAQALRAALVRHGVTVGNLQTIAPPDLAQRGAPSDAAPLWEHDSEPLRDTLADLWLPSDNLVAELLLRQLGFAAGGAPGTREHGIAYELGWLKSLGVDAGALAAEDGSGLSVYDRITPHALVTILKHDWDGPNRSIVLDDLPIAGVRGTLKSSYAGTPAEKRVFAKTGTLSHVSALAGYAANGKHGALVFAFQVDDWIGDAAALRELRARVLAAFVES